MIHTSNAFKDAMLENTRCVARATILLKDGQELLADSTNIFQEGVKIDDSTSGTSSFDIGAAVINKLTLSLNNIDDCYSCFDFTDAVITLWVGKQLGDKIEWLKKGVFNADDPQSNASVLVIEALDNMEKFDRDYDRSLRFPTTLRSIVQQGCDQCGLILATSTFDFGSYVIANEPFDRDEKITWREILQYCAQIVGCYARCNVDGNLELKWYDRDVFDRNNLDGGHYDPGTFAYQSGDKADGGNFVDFSDGDTADGGTFKNAAWDQCHHIFALNSLEVSTDDVVITGIQVTASDLIQNGGEALKGERVLYGHPGYVLDVSGNPLIRYGQAEVVAKHLGEKITGLRFRKMSASCLGDPSIEAGDAAYVTDRKGNSYQCYITNLTYTIGGYERVSSDAETPGRNTSKRYSEMTKAIVAAGKNADAKLSVYDQYVTQMNQLAINAMGYYQTVEALDDGSRITYMHDKPEMNESLVVYKISADGFFTSTDGGKNYIYGINKDGNAVMNVLAAIGVKADWINAGELVVRDKEGKEMFYASMESGAVRINAEQITIGDAPAVTEDQLERATPLFVTLNEYCGVPTNANGGSGDYSSCETTVTVMFGTRDVTPEAVITVSADPTVTGVWNESTKTYKVTNLTEDSGRVHFSIAYKSYTARANFQIGKNKKGADGVPGQDGRSYFIQPSVSVMKQGANGAFVPQNLVFNAYFRDGKSAVNTPYSGRWIVQESVDGNVFVTSFAPDYDTPSIMVAPSQTDVKIIRATLYATGGTAAPLDIQSVAIVKDIDNLTQEEVFNILTNNGEVQGIYMRDGKLYLNGQYMQIGKIADKTGESFWDLDNGEVNLSGVFLQEDKETGYKSIEIIKNGVRVYDWKRDDNHVGTLGATRSIATDREAVALYCTEGNRVAIGAQNADGNVVHILEYDSTDFSKTPKLINGGNGTIFDLNPGGGIVVENGVVKSFSMRGMSGTVSIGQGAPNRTLVMRNGLIVDIQ